MRPDPSAYLRMTLVVTHATSEMKTLYARYTTNVNFTFRRFIASCALIGALVILYFEIAKYQGPDSWFWIIIASLAAILSMIELLSPPKPL
jgi:hypothetical protein